MREFTAVFPAQLPFQVSPVGERLKRVKDRAGSIPLIHFRDRPSDALLAAVPHRDDGEDLQS